ncbi:MAG: hypothetical protein ACOH1T_03360 [Microbacteriaceae bacterium]
MVRYIRFHAPAPNARGTYPGIFALANSLERDGLLTDEDAAWLRAANDRGTASYVDPSITHPHVYDRAINPTAAAWFNETAVDVIGYARGYLNLLAKYGVPCVESRSEDPGRIIYADAVQIIVVTTETSRSEHVAF